MEANCGVLSRAVLGYSTSSILHKVEGKNYPMDRGDSTFYTSPTIAYGSDFFLDPKASNGPP
jgi:hypothetical protein